MTSREQGISLRLRIHVLFTVLALLYLTKFSEGKLRLVPKEKNKKKTNNVLAKHNARKTQQHKKKTSPTRIILKPKKKKKEGPRLQLQATVGKNENGEHVLLLTEESAAALSSALKVEQVEEGMKKVEPIKMAQQQEVLQEAEPQEHEILFYDPAELKTAPGELPLPKRVFDADGNEVDMSGKEALLVPPHHEDEQQEEVKDRDPPSPPHKEGDEPVQIQSSSSVIEEGRNVLQTPQTQDQMIIISTVATMALLVGALSARRLRSRPFLSFFIENESLEDELAYDAAYTTQSTVGASSFYAGAGYDTFGGSKFGGDLRWRGDLEKFDV